MVFTLVVDTFVNVLAHLDSAAGASAHQRVVVCFGAQHFQAVPADDFMVFTLVGETLVNVLASGLLRFSPTMAAYIAGFIAIQVPGRAALSESPLMEFTASAATLLMLAVADVNPSRAVMTRLKSHGSHGDHTEEHCQCHQHGQNSFIHYSRLTS